MNVEPTTVNALRHFFEVRLEAVIGLPVDLVVLNRAPADLVHRVLRDGVPLIERDRGARVRFEVASRNAYFDLKPLLDRYRRTEERSRG